MTHQDRSNGSFLLVGQPDQDKEYLLQALVARNLDIVLAASSACDWIEKYISLSSVIITDLFHVQTLIGDVAAYIKCHNLQLKGIGSLYDECIAQTAILASAFDLPGVPVTAVYKTSCNKLLMRQACQDLNIPMPVFQFIPQLDALSLEQAIQDIGVPCVVKPIAGSASYGTYKIDGNKSIEDVVEYVLGQTTAAQHDMFSGFNGNFLVEAYIPGKVVSVDGLVQDKHIALLGLTEFIMGDEPAFLQDGCITPPRINQQTVNECRDLTHKLISGLGLDHCGFHSEWRITPQGPRLIEIAGRVIGGVSPVSYKLAYGLEVTNALIDIWLGQPMKLRASIQRCVLDRYVRPYEAGILRRIRNIKAVTQIPQVADFRQTLKDGSLVRTYPDFPSIAYRYQVVADSHEELDEIAAYVEKTAVIEVE